MDNNVKEAIERYEAAISESYKSEKEWLRYNKTNSVVFKVKVKGSQYKYMDYLNHITDEDVTALKVSQESYKDSWKNRGGVGAFMMLARKWDRIENQVKQSIDSGDAVVSEYDILEHMIADPREEGLLDDIRDLRRYLILVEAEILSRNKK